MKNHYLQTVTRGALLGAALLSAGAAMAWSGPLASPPTCASGNPGCDAPLNISSATQTKSGLLLLANGVDVSNAGGAYSYITLHDDESPNGVKYIHANSNLVGFLSGQGNWISYTDNSGNFWTGGQINASSYINTGNYVYANELYTRDNLFLGYLNDWISNRLGQDVRSSANPAFTQLRLSRDGTPECCSSGNYTLSLAENTAGNGKLATIQFHDSGVSEGYIKLASSAFGGGREFTAGSYQTNMNVHATGYVKGDQGLCIGGDCRSSWPSAGYAPNQNVDSGANPTFTDLYVNSWFRVNGSGGIYWQQFGGGWYMSDSTWIRSYNNKPVYMSAGLDTGSASGIGCGGGLGGGSMLRVCGTLSVTSSVTASAFYYSSDARLKTDIKPLGDSLSKVLALQPVTFEWKDQARGEGAQLGFIAQQVKLVVPEIVTTDASTTLMAVDYAKVTPLLVGAVQTQEQRLDTQQKEIDDLRAEVQALKAKL